MTLLETKNLKKYFGGVKAVDDVSISVDAGEIVGIVGPNGAGKTTLINLISGYLPVTDGKIIFDSTDITNANIFDRVNMGIVRSWQIPQLFESMTVYESIILSIFVRKRKLYSMFKTDRFDDYLEEVAELSSLMNLDIRKRVGELSEGERKLLDVASAFALNTRLLLLDEPTSGVSSEEKFQVMELMIKTAKDRGTTLIVIEHDMDIVKEFFPRIIVMNEGKILSDGSPSDILKEEKVRHLLGE